MDALHHPPAIRHERLLVVRSDDKDKQTKRHAQTMKTIAGNTLCAMLLCTKNIRAKLSFLNNWFIFAVHKLRSSIRKERLRLSAFRIILLLHERIHTGFATLCSTLQALFRVFRTVQHIVYGIEHFLFRSPHPHSQHPFQYWSGARNHADAMAFVHE